jgi:DNA topoisomerase-1
MTTRRELPSTEMLIPTDAEILDLVESAGLRYLMDSEPGFARRRLKSGFRYLDHKGTLLREKQHRERIEALKIPPAWEQVWICRHANGHLQCTGRDAKGRKQYIYHKRWREMRDQTKFEKLEHFANHLPSIRRRIQADLRRPGLSRERVLATVIAIMEKTLIRVGNEEYAKENHSYGLTTLRNRHVDVKGASVRFHFRGKSGVAHNIEISDPRLAKVVRKCQELPGHELFSYLDERGVMVPVDSGDVNHYLREISGQDFTAKDFRTWGGSVLAANQLRENYVEASPTRRKRFVVDALKATASHLGNTVSVCRKYYVHPHVIDSFMEGAIFQKGLRSFLRGAGHLVRKRGLNTDESFLLHLLSFPRGKTVVAR